MIDHEDIEQPELLQGITLNQNKLEIKQIANSASKDNLGGHKGLFDDDEFENANFNGKLQE